MGRQRQALGVAVFLGAAAPALGQLTFEGLETRYLETIQPLVERSCWECHDSATRKGELDLERFTTLADVRQDPKVWQQVVQQLEWGEMPPPDAEALKEDEREKLLTWVGDFLRAEALAQAGDPGPVVIRRLSNAEYRYTIEDLTGISGLDPTVGFPEDNAAGEGFTNVGEAMAMSPALFEKYLEAGKQVAQHAVLLPEGFRFSEPISRQDRANAIVDRIRRFYSDVLQTGEIDFSYRSQVGQVRPAERSEGLLDYRRYVNLLIEAREVIGADPSQAKRLAREVGLNEKYLGALAQALWGADGGREGGALIDHLRRRLAEASPNEAGDLTAWLSAWQNRLWKFNPVGHLGGFSLDWQEPVNPLIHRQDLRLELPLAGGGDEDGNLSFALLTSTAGDHGLGDRVRWENLRLVKAGKAPVRLSEVEAVDEAFQDFRQALFQQIDRLLEAAFKIKEEPSLAEALDEWAEAQRLDVQALRLVLDYFGLGPAPAVRPSDYLSLAKENVGGQAAISGWGMQGQPDLSLLGNRSDSAWNIPGEVRPHRIVVHPMPERWVAAGWKSPISGPIEVAYFVQDRHACGNGTRWSLIHWRGGQRRVLRTGTVDAGGEAASEVIEPIAVEPGDWVSLVIDARDGHHACDLTEIELALTERRGDVRRWSLAKDCADDLLAGNPHADALGNLETWHFYSGSTNGEAPREAWKPLPGEALLGQWLKAETAEAAGELATQWREFLLTGSGERRSPEDVAMRKDWLDPQGRLLSRLDLGSLPRERLEARSVLETQSPSLHRLSVPADLFASWEVVVSATLASEDGAVQLGLETWEPGSERSQLEALKTLRVDRPVLVNRGSGGETRTKASFDAFRNLFPKAMCYARVVPIDEVVTLVLYHREDELLCRLLLDDEAKVQLDALWDELLYVSRDAFRLEVALEQIIEFATQDADPRKFTPLVEPVAARVAKLSRQLEASEASHWQALLGFAEKVYRRPLEPGEAGGLRKLYASLRGEGMVHEEAFRLTLARVLASPAFLYRSETPKPGPQSGPVDSWELATRLSYFLWSSGPDDALRSLAADGRLSHPDILAQQARRLLMDPRARRLAVQFACQWLHVKDFDTFADKNERLFPEFEPLRSAMHEEVIRFFTHLIQKDGAVRSILDAKHSFVNAELAAFYELPWEDGDASSHEWRRVDGIDRHGRGGVLGWAATLAKPSGASRTSPILRGNWISETLLGEALPDPPPDVPILPDAVDQEGLTVRELVERHRADPACARCHDRIDPYGIALEGYDTIGKRRSVLASDVETRLPDGTELSGLEGLRRYLLDDRWAAIERQFCRKLLGFALGRAARLSDEPLLDEMQAQLRPEDRFHALVEVIVRSRQFREIRGRDWGIHGEEESLP